MGAQACLGWGPESSTWLRSKLSGLGPALTTPNSCLLLLTGINFLHFRKDLIYPEESLVE